MVGAAVVRRRTQRMVKNVEVVVVFPSRMSVEDGVARLEEVLREVPMAEELQSMQRTLLPIKRSLDAGKRVSRGLPLWVAIKVIKASWHADGSWPLIGYDEAARHHICDPQLCIVPSMHVSQHKHADIIPNEAYELGKRQRKILPCTQAPPAPYMVEPDADTIARAYAARHAASPF